MKNNLSDAKGKEVISGLTALFKYYKGLGEKAMSQILDEQLHVQFNEDSNSVTIMVKHLWGNMMSRWTNFLTEDGEKEWRQRDAEFEDSIADRAELMLKWEEGWACLFNALNSLEDKDLNRVIYIRNQGHSVQEAIYRQLGHYAYHIGQIVYLCKALSNGWETLSIARGDSGTYNQQKFKEEKSRKHFTSEYNDDKK